VLNFIEDYLQHHKNKTMHSLKEQVKVTYKKIPIKSNDLGVDTRSAITIGETLVTK
jgi:hypothetical protein